MTLDVSDNCLYKVPLMNRYHIQKQIGTGSYGTIYEGRDKLTNKRVAIKMSNDKTASRQHLEWEAQVYKTMKNTRVPLQECMWPQVYDVGKSGDKLYMVMDYLGTCIDTIFKKNSCQFEPCTVAFIANRLISLLRTFHNKGYLHRDLKPQNIVATSGKFPEIHLIDYGLVKPYLNTTKTQHCPLEYKNGLKGTLRYVSIASHLGVGQSRRDDMQSLGYILVYLCKGSLPWQHLNRLKTKAEDYQHVLRYKMATPVEVLVRDIKPVELQKALLSYLLTVNSLTFTQVPPYDYLLSLFDPSVKKFDGYLR